MRGVINASEIADYWDAAAPSFDDEPDHGLRAERTHRAWDQFLRKWAAPGPSDVLDIGCGTGSLSALLAAAGHRVTGVDLSPKMIEQAQAKLTAAGLPGCFVIGDAAAPPTGGKQFDMVLARHLLWTLPAPENALREWVARLRPGGTLLLVEGRWGEAGQSGEPYVTGAETLPWTGGVLPDELASEVEPLVTTMRVEDLSDTPELWGRPVDDIRYALIAQV
jgi:ubiquinone/menaquinone biosynthesis C-methylase UbiE